MKARTVALVLVALALLLALGIFLVRELFYPGPLGGLDPSCAFASAVLIPHEPKGG